MLTKEDQKTVLFLVITGLVGGGILVVKNELVPKEQLVPHIEKQTTYRKTQKFPLDINSASEEELIRVKGIGPKIAKRIVDYRKEANGFSSLEELKNVKGIGEKTYEKLKKYFQICGQKK